MTASTVHDSTDHSESAYEQACRLIETELGGRRLTTDPAQPHDRTAGARPAGRGDDENTAVN
ncbi:hypothetical protein [Amycolatopsis kentuckyensis]|uniref:hypothetical protein n=1 Tax=Amycolatopsis kentuckyensis TaxID=218823 RepID=UPI0035672321